MRMNKLIYPRYCSNDGRLIRYFFKKDLLNFFIFILVLLLLI